MAERTISKKTRFEVFKRDSFCCQYCGRKAPEVVLEVDHIIAIANGGKNTITNLITSCFDCNRGKGKRALSENTQVDKQMKQLELLNERKNQIMMIAKWEKELMYEEEAQVDIIDSILSGYNRILNEQGRQRFKHTISRCGLEIVVESVKTSFKQYYRVGQDETINTALNMSHRIAEMVKRQKKEPYLYHSNYLLKMIKSRISYITQTQEAFIKLSLNCIFRNEYQRGELNGKFEEMKEALYLIHSKQEVIEYIGKMRKEVENGSS